MSTPSRPHPPAGAVAVFPVLTLALLAGPVLAGVAGVVAPALGWMPVLGGRALGLDAFRALLDWPGLGASVRLTLVTGLSATAISVVVTILFVAGWQGTRSFAAMMRLLAPLLAVPHAAAAFGLAFLIAPSGWIARLASPGLTGWDRPPDWLTVNDPMGLALITGLVLKEVPFLFLMTLAALGQTDSLRAARLAQTLGYGRLAGWLKVVLPQVWPQLRLPVLAVLAYSLGVVDMALILGPGLPPTLAVQVLEWMAHPDLAMRFTAAAGAVVLAALVAAAIGAFWIVERGVARLGRGWAEGGGRARVLDPVARPVGLGLAGLAAGLVLAALAGLLVWSAAGLWRFPEVLPQHWTGANWTRHMPGLRGAVLVTLGIAAASVTVAVVLVVGCLEAEYRRARPAPSRALWLLYLPLLVPQVVFLPGLQGFMLRAGLDGGVAAVTVAHVVFVLPYVYLALADPWRAWDRRMGVAAAALGAGAGRVLWSVRLPMLLRPVLTAAAVGIAVSVTQYLPTLLIGAGRVDTLATEAVALAAGANRRVIGVTAVVQMTLPMLGFWLALLVPWVVFRNRRGMAA